MEGRPAKLPTSIISSKPLVRTACTHTPLHPCIHAPMQFYMHDYMSPAACIHSHHTLQACYCSSSSNNMQLYIHAYMHTCIRAYMHTSIHAYILTCMHACIHPQMHTCIQSYMHTCMNPHMHTCIHKSIQAYIKDKGSMQARWRINAPAVMDILLYILL